MPGLQGQVQSWGGEGVSVGPAEAPAQALSITLLQEWRLKLTRRGSGSWQGQPQRKPRAPTEPGGAPLGQGQRCRGAWALSFGGSKVG